MWRNSMPKEKPLTNCKFCGTELPSRYKGRSRKFCNNKCRDQFNKANK